VSDGTEEETVLPAMAPRATADAPRTRVSITFDDGWASQMLAMEPLSAHGMPATFYISSGLIGVDRYLSRGQLKAMAGVGHEIGGHTVTHADLTDLDPRAVALEVCSSRSTLARWGFEVTSFAYPFARWNDEVREQVRQCGFNSARSLGDLASKDGCAGCEAAESVPPPDPFLIRAPAQVTDEWTLEDLQRLVTEAEAVGGWLPITFHEICERQSCSDIGVTVELFQQFLAWLQPRSQSHGTVVQTVDEVIGGEVQPLVNDASFVPEPVGAGRNGLQNPGFEDEDVEGDIVCWMQGVHGNNDGDVTFTEGRRSRVGVTITIEEYTDGAAKVIPDLDLGACAPSVEPGRSYSLQAWYRSTAETEYSVYLRHQDGRWFPWAYSPPFSPTDDWRQAEWVTPAIPSGFTGISFGLSLSRPGTLSVDDHAISVAAASGKRDENPGS
jgi:peptidoglycan/xylan/chitin deacetylase (PgdA/CDA1 family)